MVHRIFPPIHRTPPWNHVLTCSSRRRPVRRDALRPRWCYQRHSWPGRLQCLVTQWRTCLPENLLYKIQGITLSPNPMSNIRYNDSKQLFKRGSLQIKPLDTSQPLGPKWLTTPAAAKLHVAWFPSPWSGTPRSAKAELFIYIYIYINLMKGVPPLLSCTGNY